jgi:hypothetical protein
MHGAASVRIPNQYAKSEALPPRPFVRSRNRRRFRGAGRLRLGARLSPLHRHAGGGRHPDRLQQNGRGGSLRAQCTGACAACCLDPGLRRDDGGWGWCSGCRLGAVLRLGGQVWAVARMPAQSPSCRRRPAPRQASTKRQRRFAPRGQHVRVRCMLPGSRPAPG